MSSCTCCCCCSALILFCSAAEVSRAFQGLPQSTLSCHVTRPSWPLSSGSVSQVVSHLSQVSEIRPPSGLDFRAVCKDHKAKLPIFSYRTTSAVALSPICTVHPDQRAHETLDPNRPSTRDLASLGRRQAVAVGRNSVPNIVLRLSSEAKVATARKEREGESGPAFIAKASVRR